MSAARATAERPPQPAPSRGQQDTRTDAPTQALRFLALVRWLIAHGQELLVIVQRGVDAERLCSTAYRLQTVDFAVMLARITRGLMLAAGLETRLGETIASGRDVKPARLPSIARRGSSHGTGREPRPRPTNVIDLPLDRLPTAEEIAAELQRRPIGAIIVDICRDLAIRPGDLPRELQNLLTEVEIYYGGHLTVLLFKDDKQRRFDVQDWADRDWTDQESAARDAAARASHQRHIAPEPTGPS